VRRVGAPENVRWMLPQGTPPSLERVTYHSKARAALLLGLARPAALLRTGPGCALRHAAPLTAPSWCSTAAGSAWASLSWACARASPPPPSGRPAAAARRARAPSCTATAGPRCRPVRPSQALRVPQAHSASSVPAVRSKADRLGDLVQAAQLCIVAFVCSCSVCRAAAGPPSRARRVRCAPVPPRAALPAGAPRSARDFVTANAVRAILARPPAPALGPPRYARRPGFGRAPGYLARARAQRQQPSACSFLRTCRRSSSRRAAHSCTSPTYSFIWPDQAEDELQPL